MRTLHTGENGKASPNTELSFRHQAIVKSARLRQADHFWGWGKMAIGIGRREFISVFGGSTAA